MLFGRLDEDFSLDVGYPLSPLQALGLAMFKLDFKLACK